MLLYAYIVSLVPTFVYFMRLLYETHILVIFMLNHLTIRRAEQK